MNKKISFRQLTIFYFIYSFAIKFLTLPGLLAQDAGRDAWISALVTAIVEILIVFGILLFLKSKINLHKVFYIILFPIFAYEVYILCNATFDLLNDNLFDKINMFFFLTPLVLLGVFFCVMPSRAIFRSGEIFAVFILLGIVLAIAPVISRIDASEVLPIAENGVNPILRAIWNNLIYFEGFLFLLMFKGQINIKPHFVKKFMLFATVLGVCFVFFVFVFIALFGPLAPSKTVAVTSLNVDAEWLVVTMWLLMMLMRFGITINCAWRCIRNVAK